MHIRVLVIDDFPLVREGIVVGLESDPAIKVVGQSGSAADGVARARDLLPDVVILDMRMPEESGLVALNRLREEVPGTRVLVMTASRKSETVIEAISAGAAGYLTKRTTREALCQAVIAVHAGGSVVAPDVASQTLRDFVGTRAGVALKPRPLLTAREQQTLRLLGEGLTDKQIAERLFVSPRTVQNHLARIREKTGLGRRSALGRWAGEHISD